MGSEGECEGGCATALSLAVRSDSPHKSWLRRTMGLAESRNCSTWLARPAEILDAGAPAQASVQLARSSSRPEKSDAEVKPRPFPPSLRCWSFLLSLHFPPRLAPSLISSGFPSHAFLRLFLLFIARKLFLHICLRLRRFSRALFHSVVALPSVAEPILRLSSPPRFCLDTMTTPAAQEALKLDASPSTTTTQSNNIAASTQAGDGAAAQQPPTPSQQAATAQSNVGGDSLVCQWTSCGERCVTAEQLYVCRLCFSVYRKHTDKTLNRTTSANAMSVGRARTI